MMAKSEATKPRQRRGACISGPAPDHASVPHAVGLKHAIPLQIPTYWTPEQAIAVAICRYLAKQSLASIRWQRIAKDLYLVIFGKCNVEHLVDQVHAADFTERPC